MKTYKEDLIFLMLILYRIGDMKMYLQSSWCMFRWEKVYSLFFLRIRYNIFVNMCFVFIYK